MTGIAKEHGRPFGPFLPSVWAAVRGFGGGSLLSLVFGIAVAAGVLVLALLIRGVLEAAGWVLRLLTR